MIWVFFFVSKASSFVLTGMVAEKLLDFRRGLNMTFPYLLCVIILFIPHVQNQQHCEKHTGPFTDSYIILNKLKAIASSSLGFSGHI